MACGQVGEKIKTGYTYITLTFRPNCVSCVFFLQAFPYHRTNGKSSKASLMKLMMLSKKWADKDLWTWTWPFFSRLKFWMGWYDLLKTVVKWDIAMSVLEFIDRQFILKSSLDKLLQSYLNFGWKVFFSQTHLNYKQKITYCSCIFYIIVTFTI